MPDTADRELSRFQRTIVALQHSPPDEQADFAVAALSELAAVYIAEADLARSDAATAKGGDRARLLGWSLAVDQYASQLMRALEQVEQGSVISLRLGQQGPDSISVADRAVILGHPRADQQSAFEQRVLADFCGRRDCQQMTATAAAADPIPVTATRVSPHWAFTEGGPVCSINRLEVHFGNTGNIGMMRGLCEQLAQEVAALASEIAWQRRHGVDIEWDALSISATPGATEHLVRLNAAGDSLLLAVPLLFGSPQLLADIQPWVYASAAGEQPMPVRLDAADYGWIEPSR